MRPVTVIGIVLLLVILGAVAAFAAGILGGPGPASPSPSLSPELDTSADVTPVPAPDPGAVSASYLRAAQDDLQTFGFDWQKYNGDYTALCDSTGNAAYFESQSGVVIADFKILLADDSTFNAAVDSYIGYCNNNGISPDSEWVQKLRDDENTSGSIITNSMNTYNSQVRLWNSYYSSQYGNVSLMIMD